MKIYNTLTRTKEEFKPVLPDVVKIYGCGVTPYKPSHLGHAMQGVIFDVIRRYFEYKGYKTTYVRNYTDIDDKIVARAKELGVQPLEHSKNIMKQCDLDFEKLRVRKADYEPKVSDNIPEIIEIIKTLIEKGYAYDTEAGNVYYSVRSFKDYGALSRQNIEDLQHGTRKSIEEDKKDPLDFALWKVGEEGYTFWNSPWGHGRPGWHIECSAMSVKYLGKHFDIHGGGGDLIFPHHENEIAQSVAANDCPFASYWVHNGLLMVGNDKMSKSLNNDVSIGDWLKLYHPDVIRYMILTNHYRSHVQFVPERYVDANKKVYEVYKYLALVNKESAGKVDHNLLQKLMATFEESMDSDFNTVTVLAFVLEQASKLPNLTKGDEAQKIEAFTIKTYVENVGKVLGLFDLEPTEVLQTIKTMELNKRNLSPAYINTIIDKRNKARQIKDYIEADKYRNELLKLGVEILDTINGTEWDISFN